MAAIATQFTRRKEPVNKVNGLAFGAGNMSKCTNKRTESKIAHLATPKALHGVNIEVFQDDGIELVGQVVGRLELPVTSLVGNLFVCLRELVFGFLTIARSILLAGQGTVFNSNIIQRTLKEFRRNNIISRVYSGQELFQTKIETRHVTGRDINLWKVIVNLYREAKPKVAALVAFHGHCFNVAVDLAGLTKLVRSAINANLIPAKQFPATLFQGERLVLLNFLEFWASMLAAGFALLGLEKHLVRTVQALNNILYCLRIDHAPERILRQLLKFGDVLHQRVLGYVLARQLVIPALQGDAMIPNNARNINALVQMSILFVVIETVFESFSHEEIENTHVGIRDLLRNSPDPTQVSVNNFTRYRDCFANRITAHIF